MASIRAAAALATAAALLSLGAPAASAKPCRMLGATYTARPAIADKTQTHRLRIEALPRDAAGAAVATLWRFQTLARPSGRRVSELRMYFGCPNGRAACSVSPPSRPGPDGDLYSEVIQLNRDFTPTTGDAAPYAIVLPGFAQASWLFTAKQMASPDLTLAKGAQDGPDLSTQTVWLLSSCGA